MGLNEKSLDMQRNYLVALVSSIAVLMVAFAFESKVSAAEETEILKITVGEPTKLSSHRYGAPVVMVSRTGVVAVIYRGPDVMGQRGRSQTKGYRISTDGGLTWSKEMDPPAAFGGGHCSGMLRDGGVIIPAKDPHPSTDYTRAEGWTGHADPSENPKGAQKYWFDILFLRFADDMTSWHTETDRIYQYKGRAFIHGEGGLGFTKGKMIQLENGHLLAPMNGGLEGNSLGQAWINESTDQGRTWRYYATIASYRGGVPYPELPGHFTGAWEPSIALLPNGQMLAMVRIGGGHGPA